MAKTGGLQTVHQRLKSRLMAADFKLQLLINEQPEAGGTASKSEISQPARLPVRHTMFLVPRI